MIEEYLESNLTAEMTQAIAELSFEAFDSDKTVKQRIDSMLALAKSTSIENTTSRRFVIWDNDRLLAHARTFIRSVNTDNGPLAVLALASVCIRKDCRGQGLGAKVVSKAFEQIDESDWPNVSLFQTPVRVFYEKLGCRVVENEFVNRLDKANPNPNAWPWRDDTVMIFPRDANWPTGVIDLNGPDY